MSSLANLWHAAVIALPRYPLAASFSSMKLTGRELAKLREDVFKATQAGMAELLGMSRRKYQMLESADEVPYAEVLKVLGLAHLRDLTEKERGGR